MKRYKVLAWSNPAATEKDLNTLAADGFVLEYVAQRDNFPVFILSRDDGLRKTRLLHDD